MPLENHANDCECCVRTTFTAAGRKRTGEEADLTTFLPQQAPNDEAEDEEEDEEEEEPANVDEEDALLSSTLFNAFDAHVAKLDAARLKRIEALSFKSALEDDGDGEDELEEMMGRVHPTSEGGGCTS